MYDIKYFPEKLKIYRKQLGYTQAHLAELIGMSTQYYSLLENGRQSPSMAALRKLSSALEVPVASLLSDVEPMRLLQPELHKKINDLSIKELQRIAVVLEALSQLEESN